MSWKQTAFLTQETSWYAGACIPAEVFDLAGFEHPLDERSELYVDASERIVKHMALVAALPLMLLGLATGSDLFLFLLGQAAPVGTRVVISFGTGRCRLEVQTPTLAVGMVAG